MFIEVTREGSTSFNEVTNIKVTQEVVFVRDVGTGKVLTIDLSNASVSVLLGDTWHELNVGTVLGYK